MDRNLPVEVMIRDIKDVQRFLLANPADNMELTDVQLCTHGLIKLSKTGGLTRHTTPPVIPASWVMDLGNSPHSRSSNPFEKHMGEQKSKKLRQRYYT